LEIPWSFGFFKFRLESGEYVIAHAMEYIVGITLPQVEWLPSLSQLELNEILDCLASTLYKMHVQYGVAQYDTTPSNTLIRHHSVFQPTDTSSHPHDSPLVVLSISPLHRSPSRTRGPGRLPTRCHSSPCTAQNWR